MPQDTGIKEFHITKTNYKDLEILGAGSEVIKWSNIKGMLTSHINTLNALSRQERINLINMQDRPQDSEGKYRAVSQLDHAFLMHIYEKMKDVLWGKGKDKETGYQDEAGFANSELQCWNELGFINYPDFYLERKGWESAYLYTFTNNQDSEIPNLANLSIEEMKKQLLESERGSNAIAIKIAQRNINWKRLHNLPYCSKMLRYTSAILASKKSLKHEIDQLYKERI